MNQNSRNKPGPVQGVTHSLIQERTAYAVALKIGGVSMESILTTVNELSETRGWGTIGMRQLRRSISEHFAEYSRQFSPEEFELFSGLREANFAAIENTMERMAIHIRVQKVWRPFELQRALYTLFNMQCRYISIRGYDHASFQRSQIVNQRSTTQMLIDGHKGLQQAPPGTRNALVEYIRVLIDQKEREGLECDEMVETEQTFLNDETIASEVEKVPINIEPEFVYDTVPPLPFDKDFER